MHLWCLPVLLDQAVDPGEYVVVEEVVVVIKRLHCRQSQALPNLQSRPEQNTQASIMDANATHLVQQNQRRTTQVQDIDQQC